MDPNANLDEQLQLADRILAFDELGDIDPDDSVRLAELVKSLDEWITNGGFLPSAWQR